ncbi:MAG TPA: NAD(P)-binding domain-containing protein [Steroidobacteraceae bacterium]|jgi:6-phosphogluconate dehydrogenase|nr:NAD(P)-binding domain-containing protein [Steroidobacteraceae bacterium]
MQLGMVGLGRMGADMVRRLTRAAHECVVYDVNANAVSTLAQRGIVGTASPAQLVAALTPPRAIWLMVPAAVVDQELEKLVPLLAPGDIVIDGGNSYYRDDLRRGLELKSRGIHYIDVGTSGGVMGIERGYCLMIGGEKEIVEHLKPIFVALAPGVAKDSDATEAERGKSTADQGYLHCGPQGAGHFVKMVPSPESDTLPAYSVSDRSGIPREGSDHEHSVFPVCEIRFWSRSGTATT